jgi:hypothetical protein
VEVQFGIHGEPESAIRALKIMPPIAIDQDRLEMTESRAHEIRQPGPVIGGGKGGAVDGTIEVKRWQRKALFAVDEAAFDFVLEHGMIDGASELAIPTNAGFDPMGGAADMIVVIVERRGIEVDVVDGAARIGFTERGRVSSHLARTSAMGTSWMVNLRSYRQCDPVSMAAPD